MRDINVTKYRKILQKLQLVFSSAKWMLSMYYKNQDGLTDFARGDINGQHTVYNKVLRVLDKEIAIADATWNDTHCREEKDLTETDGVDSTKVKMDEVYKAIYDGTMYYLGVHDFAKYMHDYYGGKEPIYPSEMDEILDKFLESVGVSEDARKEMALED